ncbi:MAG: hypothetical protein AAGF47_10810 [Planctomycetota bacterium]
MGRCFFRDRVAVGITGLAGMVAGGCTGVEPAVLGFGVQAAEQGVAFIDGIDVHAFELARYDDVVAAVDRSAGVLGLEEYSRRHVRESHVIIRYRLQARGRVIVEVRAETPTISRIRCEVNTGLRRGISSLFFRQLIHELLEADAFIEEWAGSSDDSRGLE